MRRPVAISAFALVLTLPLWAQHGGGHGGGHVSGGGHASFGGGHGFAGHGGFGGSHSSVGVHSFSGPLSSARVHAFNHPGATGPFLHNSFRQGFRFGIRNGFRSGCWGYGCWGYGYPWWGYTYNPWWWWDNDSSYDDTYEQDLANANLMNEQSLEEQRMLRQEEADGDQDAYAPSPRRSPYVQPGQEAAPAAKPSSGSPLMPETVLVFRDHHQQEIENYAIVGQTLWSFAPEHNQRIPLSDLDLTATAQANDDRGLTFRIPTAR
jgi:hypothetical protein